MSEDRTPPTLLCLEQQLCWNTCFGRFLFYALEVLPIFAVERLHQGVFSETSALLAIEWLLKK